MTPPVRGVTAAVLGAAAALGLAACDRLGPAQDRLEAGRDVAAFLGAAKSGDRATFEKHVDRTALRAQLRPVLEQQLKAKFGDRSRFLTRGGQLDRLVDGVVSPESFQIAVQGPAAAVLGDRAPPAAAVAAALKADGENRFCVPRSPGGPCTATFTRQGTAEAPVWRLTAVDVASLRLIGG